MKSMSIFRFTFTKDKVELHNFDHLPVIKEEEGYVTEEKSIFPQTLLKTNVMNKNYDKKTDHENRFRKNCKSTEKLNSANIFINLSSVMNVNCFMNTDVKQTKAIWNTNFGKRLINGKKPVENKTFTNIKAVQSDIVRKSKARIYQKLHHFFGRKSIREQKVTTEEGVKAGFNRKKQSKEFKSESQNNVKKTASEKTNILKSTSELCPSGSFLEILLKESKENNPTPATAFKNNKILTQCVKNILNQDSNEASCEYCNQSFSDPEELLNHNNQHKIIQEICVICKKGFSNQNEFIQHLLTHESVDQLSCKKCKKYFPNLKKYKMHCKNFHSVSSLSVHYYAKSS